MKFALSLLSCLLMFLITPHLSRAIENPLSLPNNKMGVHILFTDEIDAAARIVNNGGDWGYVTIPIQVGDKDQEKWQKFMNDARSQHIIPIIRLSTEGDYFNTSVWKKPSEADVLDFANFLNSLDWPVKNKYVTVFNEVNRGDEWNGSLSPKEYAEILNYAVVIFKSLSQDFFIISAGLDNAAPNSSDKYMNQYDYMIAMNEAKPGIFGIIDGLGSHSYPNPGFKQPAYKLTSQSIYSFNFERNLAFRLSGKNLPIFITETGWSKEELSEDQIASNFRYAFEHVWSDKDIVAITPFLLQAGAGPFKKFSLLKESGEFNLISTALREISKVKGKPSVNNGARITSSSIDTKIPLKIFPQKTQYALLPQEKTDAVTTFFKWILKLSI
ncbi:MAG: hypothetical protein Q8P26_05250 [Candidatus Levybacteria bacterium]|nr:hypothetical protein [Candidatus Levybacteria bacterium]